MIKRKALRKIYITTMSLFIIMTVYIISDFNTMKTSMEFDYISNLANSSIYLLDQNNRLVKTKVFLDSKNDHDKIKIIVNDLRISENNIFPETLKGVLSDKIKLNSIEIKDKTAHLDFNKALKESDNLEKIIESLVYSITELKTISNIKITINGQNLENYNELLDREIGINKNYEYTSLKNINKVVIYYNETIDNSLYYVPVTKYINTKEDKINIIIEELTTNYIYQDNLQSILNEDIKLINKEIIDDLLILDFNSALSIMDSKLKEEVLYTISYAVFDNYDINTISFQTNGKKIRNITRSSLV